MIYVTSVDDAAKHVSSPLFDSCQLINPELLQINKFKAKVTLNKPVFIGVAILDLSKLIMYRYFYDTLKKSFNNRINLLYTDTDRYVFRFLEHK